MTNENNNSVPGWFWLVGVLALLWYAFGVFVFFTEVTMDSEAIAKLPENQQAFMAKIPSWYYWVFGVSVISGILACIALLLKRGIAAPLFIISLIFALIQDIYGFGFMNVLEDLGPSALGIAVAVVVVGVLMIFHTNRSKARGWLH